MRALWRLLSIWGLKSMHSVRVLDRVRRFFAWCMRGMHGVKES